MPVDRLSHSSINTYMLCPKSWWYRYIKKPEVPISAALPFGTAIHKTIQYHLNLKVLNPNQPLPSLVGLWSTHWEHTLAEQRREITWDKSQATYNKLGLDMLKSDSVINAIDAIKPIFAPLDTPDGFGRAVLTEYKVDFTVPGVPVPIVGYIDIIASDNVPIDFKTAGRKWSRGKEHFELQPDFYLAGLNQENFVVPENKFRYYILTKTKTPTCLVLETQRTWSQIFWTFQTIREIWQAIQAGSFAPDTTCWKCRPEYCEYWQICRGRQ
jgi:CRISPR/Cas system-associated exonuclease Cas4 (RecB family)